MKTLIMIVVALALGAAPCLAQTPAGLERGELVRATYRIEVGPGTRTSEVSGGYVSLTPQRLRLTVGSTDSQMQEVARDRLLRLEVREHSAARGAGKGAIYGGIAGAVLALIPTAGLCSEFTCGGEDYALASLAVGGIGAGVGALLGAVIGSERWREVRLDPDTGSAP